MATTTASRVPLGWLVTTAGAVVVVFLSGFIVAGGSTGLPVLALAAASGYLIGCVSFLPVKRRRYRVAGSARGARPRLAEPGGRPSPVGARRPTSRR